MIMENDFDINEMDLDGEWLRQPGLYEMWARLSARAQKERARIHLKRKIMKARLYKEAKVKLSSLPGSKEGKEPTGAAIEAEVRTSKEYEEVSLELIDAEEKASLMDAGKWSMIEKGKALDQLCEDRDKGFFMPSSSREKSPNQDRRQEKLREIDKGLREVLTEKKRINRG